MPERLFIPRTKTGAVLRIAFWGTFVSIMAIFVTQFTYSHVFPDIWVRHGSLLPYFIFAISAVIAVPVLTAFFMISLRMHTVNVRLREIAQRDGLTGLLNRNTFEDLIRRRQAGPALPDAHEDALIIIDLDHFKSINDGHGHSAGDHVLRMVSICIAGNVFERDHVARIGGEEFAVYLLGSGATGAVRAAERIRSALEENKAHFEGETIRITASLGGALYPRGAAYQTVYRGADNALYRAKNAGRNRSEFNGLPMNAASGRRATDGAAGTPQRRAGDQPASAARRSASK